MTDWSAWRYGKPGSTTGVVETSMTFDPWFPWIPWSHAYRWRREPFEAFLLNFIADPEQAVVPTKSGPLRVEDA